MQSRRSHWNNNNWTPFVRLILYNTRFELRAEPGFITVACIVYYYHSVQAKAIQEAKQLIFHIFTIFHNFWRLTEISKCIPFRNIKRTLSPRAPSRCLAHSSSKIKNLFTIRSKTSNGLLFCLRILCFLFTWPSTYSSFSHAHCCVPFFVARCFQRRRDFD